MTFWIPSVVAFGLSVLLTTACRSVALHAGIVSKPAADRWSTNVVPLLGGPAMVTATALAMGLVDGLPLEVWILLAGAVAMSLVGVVDDLRPIGPATKLTAQVVAAAAVTGAGLRFPLTGIAVVDIPITMFWLVGLTNAFNLLDNMDGLAAGIAAIAGSVKLALFLLDGELAGAAAAAVFVAACLGFLVHNLIPRRVFMGDSGSLFLGFFVAGLSTVGPEPGSRATMSVLILPVVLMLVPIFDTVLVTVARTLTGRRISQGGRDHASHRLVTAGLTERSAVFTLYALAAISGAVAIATRGAGLYAGLLFLLVLGMAMLILGVSLARIAVYKTEPAAPDRRLRLPLTPGAAYVRPAATATINLALVFMSYYAAYAFRFGTEGTLGDPTFVESLPVVVSAKMLALGLFGTYRRVWRYTDSRDLTALVSASTVGSVIALVVVLFAYQFDGYARSVFVLDWILFTTMLAASRLSLRALSEMLRPVPSGATRVLVYGAGEAGVSLLQELRRNPRHGRTVVGFCDDDPMKRHTRIQGLQVFGGLAALPAALAESGAEELVIAVSEVPAETLAQIQTVCETTGVRMSRFDISVSMAGVDARVDPLT